MKLNNVRSLMGLIMILLPFFPIINWDTPLGLLMMPIGVFLFMTPLDKWDSEFKEKKARAHHDLEETTNV